LKSKQVNLQFERLFQGSDASDSKMLRKE
jgi:hypothetical protein